MVTMLFRCVRKQLGFIGPGTMVVLYYHGVPDDARSSFGHQLDVLCRIALPVSASTSAPFPSGQHHVAITFDDAFQSVTRNAVPELEHRGMQATVFVPVGELGQQPTWALGNNHDRSELIITEEELKRLPPHIISLGSHTLTHPHLPRITTDEARRELTESKLRLEEIVGRPVTLFAFPHGAWNDELVQLCQEVGYDRLFTIEPQLVHGRPSAPRIGRVAISPYDPPFLVRLKALGAYRWMPAISAAKRRLGIIGPILFPRFDR